MRLVATARMFAAAALAGGLAAAGSAMADTPDATISFGQTTIAFVGSLQWGSGTLHVHGRNIPLKISGVGVGAIGANKFSAEGDVFHLRHADDIFGTYTAVNANATAGAGAGILDMTNEHGVEIRAHATSAGLSLSLAPTGMVVKPK